VFLSVQCGLVYTEEEWDREWQYIVNLSNWQPKNQSNAINAVSSNRYNMPPTLSVSNFIGGTVVSLFNMILKSGVQA